MHAELPSAVFRYPTPHLRQPGDAGTFVNVEESAVHLPEGWTDDLSVDFVPGMSEDALVEKLIAAFKDDIDFDVIHSEIISPYLTNPEDADLVLDRALGGIVRALTGNMRSCPDQTKDPIAWRTFMVVWETLPKKSWFSSDRKAQGFWNDWHDNLLKKLG
jgi:hypothetical protein